MEPPTTVGSEAVTSQRRTTIDDVARRAGVSKGAVSFAVNGRSGVAPATRERILQAAADLNFRPSARGRALSSSRAFALGLVVARPARLLAADPFFPQFIAGIETELSGRGSSLVLQVVPDDPEVEAAGYRRLHAEGRVDGVFLTDLRSGDHRIALLASLGLPAVAVGQPQDLVPFPCVGVDDSAGVTAAVKHLVGLGHERIGHVGGPARYVHSISRRQAWRAAVRAAGLAPGPLVTGDWGAGSGAAATRRMLRLSTPPTAIVYANDLMATAGMGAARALGRHIPDDLSVVGFDDAPLSAHLQPALTTVTQDVESWGRTATRVLLELTEGSARSDGVLTPSRLVVRSSTSPPSDRASP